MPVAEHWSVPPSTSSQAVSAPAHEPPFWDRFQSDELRELQRVAAEASFDNASAAARAAQQAAVARVARAPWYPALSAQAGLTGQSENGNTLSSIAGAFVDVGLTLSYSPDLWGRTRGATDAADARSQASLFDRESIELAVAAAVAETYFEVLSLRDRIASGHDNLGAMRRILEVVESKHRAGTALVREVAQQKALVASEAARVAQLSQAEGDARVSLAVVSGRDPSALPVRGRSLDEVVDPTLSLADVDVPARLMTRRPDVARAEQQLVAADADVEAARAALLPQLNLVGTAAFQSIFLSEHYDGSGFVYTGQAQLIQPIFDGGERGNQRDAASARRAEAEAEYRRVVLIAVAEVERALRALGSLQEQSEQRRIVVDEARRALGLIEGEYQAGAAELLTVLDAQRTLLSAQDELSQVRLAKLRAAALLIKALGGGWSRG